MFETVKAIHEAFGITSPKIFIAMVTLLFALIGFVAAVIVERGYQNKLRLDSNTIQQSASDRRPPSSEQVNANPKRTTNVPEDNTQEPRPQKPRTDKPNVRIVQQSSAPDSPNVATFGDNSPVTINRKPDPYAAVVYYEFNGIKHVQQGNSFRAESGEQQGAFIRFIELEKQKDWAKLRDLAEEQISKAPEWFTAYIEAGVAYANLGQPEDAIKRLQYVADKAPSSDEHYAIAGRLLSEIRRGR